MLQFWNYLDKWNRVGYSHRKRWKQKWHWSLVLNFLAVQNPRKKRIITNNLNKFASIYCVNKKSTFSGAFNKFLWILYGNWMISKVHSESAFSMFFSLMKLWYSIRQWSWSNQPKMYSFSLKIGFVVIFDLVKI